MNRQCAGCGTVLPPERRSPHCEPCRVEYQRQRNREKVWAYRNRAREALANQTNPGESRPPNDEEFGWLEAVNPDLGVPIRRVHELLDQGRTVTDGEVARLALGALQEYDNTRELFEAEVTPETEPIATSWRGYFESIRGALG
jgi:hypothetical protein